MNDNIWNRIPPVTKNLILINVLVWLPMMLIPSFGNTMTRICGLHYFASPDFGFWQLVTYMFLHSPQGLSHILFNMFGVWMFGSAIERVFGSARYLLFYLTVGVGAALIQEGVYAIWISQLLPPQVSLSMIAQGMLPLGMSVTPDLQEAYMLINAPTVGASGALYGVLLAFAMIFPNMPLYFFFIPVPVKAKWMVLGYFVIELFFGVTGLQSGVAHFAHLGGMIVAFLLIIYWRKRGEINRGPLY